MKRIILIFGLLATVICASAQVSLSDNSEQVANFIDSCRGEEQITTIELTSEMTKILAKKLREAGNKSADLMESIHSMQIVVRNGKSERMLKSMQRLVDDCETLKLVSSIERSFESSRFYFYSGEEPELSEFLMIVINDKPEEEMQYIVLYITGDFSVTDISLLSSLGGGEKR